MEGTKFTPGPFEVVEFELGKSKRKLIEIDQCGPTGHPSLASITNNGLSYEECLANAHLFAAAPEMYLALKRLAGEMNLQAETIDGEFVTDFIERVLKKAEGK